MSDLSYYQETGQASFRVGDKVIFNSYGRKSECVVREVGVTKHLFKPDARVFYRLDGQAETICTAARMSHK